MSQLIPGRFRGDEPLPSLFRNRFFREFDDLVNRFFGEDALTGHTPRTFSPAIDISETDEEFIVTGEIPGVDPKELDVSLQGQVLTIKGEKTEEHEEETEGSYRKERCFGSFSRSFTLPCEVQEDKIQATFQNGVISLRLPKIIKAQKRSIKIDMEK